MNKEFSKANHILHQSKSLVDMHKFRRQIYRELNERFNRSYSIKLWLLDYHQNRGALYYHNRKLNLNEELYRKYGFLRTRKVYDVPTWPSLRLIQSDRVQVGSYLKSKKKYLKHHHHLVDCIKIMAKLQNTFQCTHEGKKKLMKRSSEQLKNFTCSMCNLRLTSQANYFSTSILSNAISEYEQKSFEQILNLEICRTRMICEDLRVKLSTSEENVSFNCRHLLQRFFSTYLNEKRQRKIKIRFEESKRLAVERENRKGRIWWENIRTKAVRLNTVVCKLYKGQKAKQTAQKIINRLEEEQRDCMLLHGHKIEDKSYMGEMKALKRGQLPLRKQIKLQEENELRYYDAECGHIQFKNQTELKHHMQKHNDKNRRIEIEKDFLNKLEDPQSYLDEKFKHTYVSEENSKKRKLEHRIERPLPTLKKSCPFLLLLSDSIGLPRIIPLQHEKILIGRSHSCDIRLDTKVCKRMVSKQHATIHVNIIDGSNFEVFLEDLGSTNGSYINGKKLFVSIHPEVVTSTKPLKDGDIVDLGPPTLTPITYVFKTDERSISSTVLPPLHFQVK